MSTRGATNVYLESGDMMLAAGVEVVDVLKVTDVARTFAYSVSVGESITFAVKVKSTGMSLYASFRNIEENAELSFAEASSASEGKLKFVAFASTDFELVVPGVGNITALGDTVFSVAINTSI